jgi:hypothetical protein
MMMRKENQPPKMSISQQSVIPAQQRPPMVQRPPVAQPGMVQGIATMMKWLVIGMVVFIALVLVIVMVAANFKTFQQGSKGFIEFVFSMLPSIIILALTAAAIKFLKKEILTVWNTFLHSRLVDARIRTVDASIEDRHTTVKAQSKIAEESAGVQKAIAWQKHHSLPVSEQNSAIYVDDLGRPAPMPMPQAQFPAHLHSLSFHNAPRVTGISEEINSPKQLEAADEARNIHIPTFSESMNAGLIGPGQKQMLICYQLERDEDTGQLTGAMEPYQIEKPEDNSTNFIGGTGGSGKTTFMAHLCSQGAMMNALYYIIDPHLTHLEKSIAVKLEAMKHAFILPPAMSTVEIYNVKRHAEQEAIARMNGRETPYSGRPIFFVVDEVLNVLGRAQRASNPEELEFWRDFVLFLRDLGTQYNKFGVNGMFASQYVTKEAFKIPRYQVDFRDGCQSQTLFRLPPNQAQAMRLLDSADLRGARRLPQGHGYMGFMNGDVIRMATGNVTLDDIRLAAMQVDPAREPRRYSMGTGSVQGSNRSQADERARIVEAANHSTTDEHETPTRTTGELDLNGTFDEEPLEQGTETVPEETGTTRRGKEFTPEQELVFIKWYHQYRSIKRCLAEMHLSYGDYQACASRLVQRMQMGQK